MKIFKINKKGKKIIKNFFNFVLIFFLILSSAFSEPTAKEAHAAPVTIVLNYNQTILTEGTGPKPAITDKVKVHYHGTLLDGTIFDSSVQRGEPLVISVNGVIQGWVEALQMMPTGSKWRLFIPSNLAYGDNDAGPTIKAGSTLIFDVELLEIQK